MTDLKPCPFCGGEAKIDQEDTYPYRYDLFRCHCVDCGIGYRGSTREEVAEKWNERVSE